MIVIEGWKLDCLEFLLGSAVDSRKWSIYSISFLHNTKICFWRLWQTVKERRYF